MKKKTIIHLTPAYLPHVGGVEEHVSQLSAELNRRDFDCQVITLQQNATWPIHEEVNGITVDRLPVLSDPGFHQSKIKKTLYKLNLWFHLIRFLPQLISADIVQVHDVFWWIWPFLLFLPKKKRFITFHGYEGDENPTLKQQQSHQHSARLTQANLCIGGFHQKWYGVQPTKISFGAIDPAKISPTELVIPSTKPVVSDLLNIIYLGRLQADAGIMAYLESIQIFISRQKHQSQPTVTALHLDVYGDGPQRSECEKFVSKHDLPVTFHGWVAHASQLLPDYNLAFISRYLAIIESLAQGVPVMAQFNSAIKEDYLKLTPFAKWIRTFDSAKKGAQLLAQQPKISDDAIQWARHQTWSKMADTYEQLWFPKQD